MRGLYVAVRIELNELQKKLIYPPRAQNNLPLMPLTVVRPHERF